MSTGYRIKELADRSGFSPSALRYYEEIGVLPAPQRTPSGYRVYDERALDRLAFIARAKRLGCTLDEIAELVAAWEGGACGPVQDGLRGVVTGKIEHVRAQIAELVAFGADLQRAAATLGRHRPDGPCDDRCGCISEVDADGSLGAAPVALTGTATIAACEPLACSLTAGEVGDRVDDWQSLLAHAVAREPIPGGVRLAFGPTLPLDDLLRLVTAEQSCCQFFAFAITVDARGVGLEVTAPAEAAPVVEALFGAAA